MDTQKTQNFLSDFNFKLGKFSVPTNSISKFTIDYNIEKPYISGSFEITTEFNLDEALQFSGELELDFQAKDILDTKIHEKFIVFDFCSVREASKVFKSYGTFIDSISWELSKIYVSKAFKEVDLQTILTDSDISKDIFTKTDKKQDFDELEKLDEFVVCSNKNILSIQDRLKEIFNCVYFYTRDSIKIKKWDNLYKAKMLEIGGKEITYASPPKQSVSLFDIIEYKNVTLKGLDTNKYGAKVKAYSYNPLKRTNKPFEYSLSEATKDLKALKDLDDSYTGIKTLYFSDANLELQTKYQFQRFLMFNSQLLILSSGFLCVNIGDTAKVSITGNEKDAENVSGEYLITRVTDNIEQGYLTQKVELSRPSPDKV